MRGGHIKRQKQHGGRTNNFSQRRAGGNSGNRPFKTSHKGKPFRKFENNRADGDQQPSFKRRIIRKKNQNGSQPRIRGAGRVEKRKDDKDRDLDRQLRDYWISKNKAERADKNEKAAEGKESNKKLDADMPEFARKKLNSELDDYWKQRKQQADKKVE